MLIGPTLVFPGYSEHELPNPFMNSLWIFGPCLYLALLVLIQELCPGRQDPISALFLPL